MAYVNLAAATKSHRANQIVADLGTSGLMSLYTGAIPASPDIPTTGTLLATLPLAPEAAVVSLGVREAVISDPGSGGVDGTYALTFSGGGGFGAAGYFIVASTVMVSVVISATGSGYDTAPTIGGFGTAGLTGGAVTPVMTAIISFNPMTTATAVGTGAIGVARFTTADATPILDLDVGTTNDFSVVTNNLNVMAGGSVSCTAEVLIEQ
jgi:hypothetical protein